MTVTSLLLTAVMRIGPAYAGVILPIDATGTPDPTRPVTVSLFDAGGRDVTDTWLPTWEPATGGPTIYVSFNALGLPATPSSVTLKTFGGIPVFNGAINPFWTLPPTTSAYPGRCTNYDGDPRPAPGSSDYTFNPVGTAIPGTQRIGFALKSEDCGGMAVIEAVFSSGGAAGTYTFVIPQDSNRNGIPDIWEAKFCPNNSCPLGIEDSDAGPLMPSPTGDGIAAFDEYRGFIIGGQHVSTDPRQRDLFVTLGSAQCGDPTQALLGGGATTFPNDGGTAFGNLASLLTGSQIHVRNYRSGQASTVAAEWVDRFAGYSEQIDPTTGRSGFKYLDAAGNVTYVAPVDDRRINANAVFAPAGLVIHRGLRLTECLDVASSQPLGSTGIGTPDGPDSSLVYTLRIVNYINTLIARGGTRALKLFTFQNGAWVEQKKANGAAVDADFVISQAIKFYVAHELTHSTQLTPTVEGTKQTSYGYHHAPGTGSVMDQTITQKIDKSTSGFNSFYIPSIYNGSDQSSYKTD